MDQHALVTVKDVIRLMKNLQEVLPSQTSHPSIEIACSMRRPTRRPNAIQAELEAPMRINHRRLSLSHPVIPTMGATGRRPWAQHAASAIGRDSYNSPNPA